MWAAIEAGASSTPDTSSAPQQQWQRQARPLSVREEAKPMLKRLLAAVLAAAKATQDPTLQQEAVVLHRLVGT